MYYFAEAFHACANVIMSHTCVIALRNILRVCVCSNIHLTSQRQSQRNLNNFQLRASLNVTFIKLNDKKKHKNNNNNNNEKFFYKNYNHSIFHAHLLATYMIEENLVKKNKNIL
jgi:hypothetical protein